MCINNLETFCFLVALFVECEGRKNIDIPDGSDVIMFSVCSRQFLLAICQVIQIFLCSWLYLLRGVVAAASSLLEMLKMKEQPGLCNQNTMTLLFF